MNLHEKNCNFIATVSDTDINGYWKDLNMIQIYILLSFFFFEIQKKKSI